MGDSLKILLIHGMPSQWLGQRTIQRTVYNREFALLRYAPEHRYVLWCPHLPITPALRRQAKEADAILLGTTLLCARWMRPREKFTALLDDYRFIADAPGRVIAFPQDDYYMNETLDDWFESWNVDTVYTPLLEHQAILYPKTHKRAKMRHAFTGYADDGDRILCSRWAKKFDEREIDVSYRAKNLPHYFGKLGRQKAEIADRFVLGLLRYGANLKIDIQTGHNSTHFGTTWLKFLGDSKFVLGSPSGASMLDPRGEIHDAIEAHEKRMDRQLTYEMAEASFFPGQDVYEFGAMGPRNIEAALAGCCQILAASSQWTPMKAGEHFIELAPDCSNMGDVLKQMQDTEYVKWIIANARLLFERYEYSYGGWVNEILDDLQGSHNLRDMRQLHGVDALLADYRMQNAIWDSELAPPE